MLLNRSHDLHENCKGKDDTKFYLFFFQEMGLPVRHLICASNTNHVLTDFIKNGAYVLTGRSLYRTASPSIDILQSSNLERLIFHLSGENPKTVRHFYSTLQKEGVAPAPKEVSKLFLNWTHWFQLWPIVMQLLSYVDVSVAIIV